MLRINSSLNISSSTESHSVSTGALVVSGGIGIAQNVNIGGNLTVIGDICQGNASLASINLQLSTLQAQLLSPQFAMRSIVMCYWTGMYEPPYTFYNNPVPSNLSPYLCPSVLLQIGSSIGYSDSTGVWELSGGSLGSSFLCEASLMLGYSIIGGCSQYGFRDMDSSSLFGVFGYLNSAGREVGHGMQSRALAPIVSGAGQIRRIQLVHIDDCGASVTAILGALSFVSCRQL